MFVQVASSERLLSVEIQHYENMFNAEIRDGEYCCCDQPSQPLCVQNIENLDTEECTDMCQPYFVIYFQTCPSSKTCYLANNYTVSGDFSAATSLFFIQILFNQSELEKYNQVRI